MNEFERCPFCGCEVENKFPQMMKLPGGLWSFHHYCDSGSVIGTSVFITGETEQEVIERWNRRAADVQEHIAN